MEPDGLRGTQRAVSEQVEIGHGVGLGRDTFMQLVWVFNDLYLTPFGSVIFDPLGELAMTDMARFCKRIETELLEIGRVNQYKLIRRSK